MDQKNKTNKKKKKRGDGEDGWMEKQSGAENEAIYLVVTIGGEDAEDAK